MHKRVRMLAGMFAVLASTSSLADSVAGPAQLALTADCSALASAQWSFTFTQSPQREFGLVTNLNGVELRSYDIPSPLAASPAPGSFSGTWRQDILVPQPPNTLIGTYGGAGDTPPTAAQTVEFFILYNCTTRQVLYSCSGNLGACPRTAAQGLARITQPIPAQSPATLAALLLVLAASGAWLLRRRAVAR